MSGVLMVESAPRASFESEDGLRLLSAKFEGLSTEELIQWSADTFDDDLAVSSSFGADSAAMSASAC